MVAPSVSARTRERAARKAGLVARASSSTSALPSEPGWLLFIHQIPPKPAYFRAKVGRRLQRLGAIAVKSTVYVLPRSRETQEDFHWLAKEIVAQGGEATLCLASFVEGLSDDELKTLFRDTRNAEYRELASEAAALASKKSTGDESDLGRVRRRMEEIAAIDFFEAPARSEAVRAIELLERAVRGDVEGSARAGRSKRAGDYLGRTWVTRAGVHVDRIASAWLVRRFIDPDAAFKFVPPKGYQPLPGELRFDMFDAEFTHEGDECTFEVLVRRFELDHRGLRALAEIIHDIDIKDGKYGRAETAGVACTIAGLALRHREDLDRLDRGFAFFDDLLAFFERKE